MQNILARLKSGWQLATGDNLSASPLMHGLIMRFLGLVSFAAFGSYWRQLPGLIGSRGVLPAGLILNVMREQLPGPISRWFYVPTLAWLSSSDFALNAMCAAGVVASLVLAVGFFPRVCCFLLWALYLSLGNADQIFMGFQWDGLLIETLFLGIFITPERLFLVRWLLFKLMFSSGMCKLSSGDPTWRGLTALTVHYETEPIPNPLSWHAHQLPAWFQMVSTAATLFIELPVPFLVFVRARPARLAAFAFLAGLQLLIMLTGNFAFFNILTLVLCLSVLRDHDLGRLASRGWIRVRLSAGRAGMILGRFAYPAVAALALITGLVHMGITSHSYETGDFTELVIENLGPFRTFNGYGLFANMTTTRLEITLEGSDDASNWKAYEFAWKPGPLDRAPPVIAPYQPRLDWQMWFAALAPYRASPWLKNLEVRLLEGSPEVVGLLSKDPFPARPPRYVRARIARYTFTTPEQKAKTGNWWNSGPSEDFGPVLSLH